MHLFTEVSRSQVDSVNVQSVNLHTQRLPVHSNWLGPGYVNFVNFVQRIERPVVYMVSITTDRTPPQTITSFQPVTVSAELMLGVEVAFPILTELSFT